MCPGLLAQQSINRPTAAYDWVSSLHFEVDKQLAGCSALILCAQLRGSFVTKFSESHDRASQPQPMRRRSGRKTWSGSP